MGRQPITIYVWAAGPLPPGAEEDDACVAAEAQLTVVFTAPAMMKVMTPP